MKIHKKASDRIAKNLSNYKKVLKKAYDRDINESDTVAIIVDMLEDIFGYDKYDDVTSEYAIKGTFCDLAIKTNGQLKFLIEVKAIGINLKDNHLNQALAYGAKEGLDWVILTNAVIWEVYHVIRAPKLEAVLLFKINFLDLTLKQHDQIECLYTICKEAQSVNAISELNEKLNILNKHMVSAIITEDTVVNAIRLAINKISNIKATNEEIYDIVFNDVIKRDIIEDEAYKKAKSKIKRVKNKTNKEA
ncbi:MAG: hypothetical protein WC274_05840 [Sulfurimonas sp.]